MIIAVNGSLVEEHEAVISVFDHGFMYGMGCFETFRTYGGRPFLFDRHMDRLKESVAAIGIEWNADRAEARALIERLLQANGLTDAYVRYAVSAGTGAVGLPTEAYTAPNTIVYVKPLPASGEDDKPAARPLQVLKLPRNTPEGTRRLKSFHYMNNILGKRELNAYPWAAGAEGLFLTADGHVAEGIVSNVFFAKGDTVCTPSVGTGILPGITRAFVIALLRQAGVAVEEGAFTLEQLTAANELFLTNSVQEIVQVDRLYDPEGGVIWRRQEAGAEPAESMVHRLLRSYRQAAKGGCDRHDATTGDGE